MIVDVPASKVRFVVDNMDHVPTVHTDEAILRFLVNIELEVKVVNDTSLDPALIVPELKVMTPMFISWLFMFNVPPFNWKPLDVLPDVNASLKLKVPELTLTLIGIDLPFVVKVQSASICQVLAPAFEMNVIPLPKMILPWTTKYQLPIFIVPV